MRVAASLIRGVSVFAVLLLVMGCSGSSSSGGGEGQQLFSAWCAPCHGGDGSGGLGYKGPSLHGPEFIYGGDRQAILASTRQGRGEEMPAFKKRLDDEEIEAVVDYVMTLRDK